MFFIFTKMYALLQAYRKQFFNSISYYITFGGDMVAEAIV